MGAYDTAIWSSVRSDVRCRKGSQAVKRANSVSSAATVQRRVVATCLAWLVALCSFAASAHPLGNNTVNRQAALQINARTLQLRYLMDLAEIPTLFETQKADIDHDGVVSQQEWNAYARQWAERLLAQLHLELDGRPVSLQLQSQRVGLQPGSANLTILRLEGDYTATLLSDSNVAVLHYRDDHTPELSGWKEVWVYATNGTLITRSTRPPKDRSRGLTQYDAYRTAPPNELTADATLDFTAAAAAVTARQDTPAVAASRIPTPTTGAAAAGATSSAAPLSMSQQAWAFFRLGVHHIATGWDHLVFLFGLLLLAKSLPQLIKTVTAFTVAHSLTLALAANHWVTPPGPWVEPAIALTIAYVGLVNLVWRSSAHGAWLAFGFGLVHGFGFAGALAQTLGDQRSTDHHWLVNLLSFNIGIEAFQLLLVSVCVPVLHWATSQLWFGTARRFASCGVLSAGLAWFLMRTIT